MNICLVTGTFLPRIGGRELVVHDLATALSSMGHDVTVLVSYNRRREATSGSYRLVQAGFRGSGKLHLHFAVMFLMLAYVVRKYKVDVIHVHNVFKPGTTVYWYTRLFRKPTVGTPHGDDIQTDARIGYGVRLDVGNDRRIMRNVRAFSMLTAISGSIRTHLEEIVRKEGKVVDIPNGVWTSSFSRSTDPFSVRRRHGVLSNRQTLISIGRNHPKKGFDVGVRVLHELRSRGIDVQYVIVGRGMDPIRELSVQLEVDDYLITPGELGTEEVTDLLQIADIYLSCASVESFGLTTLEAMCAGLPCVLTDVEGSRDLHRADQAFGVLVRSGDVMGTANAIQGMISTPDRTKEMGERAKLASRQYDWTAIGAKYESVYREALNRTRSDGIHPDSGRADRVSGRLQAKRPRGTNPRSRDRAAREHL